MDAKGSGFDPRFSYSEIEGILAIVFNAGPEGLSKLRARWKHFQKLKLLGKTLGKGNKQKYALEDLLVMLFAFELSEFGLDPQLIAVMVSELDLEDDQRHNNNAVFLLSQILLSADLEQELTYYLAFSPAAMSWRWTDPNQKVENFFSVLKYELLRIGDVEKFLRGPRRACLIDLTDLARRTLSSIAVVRAREAAIGNDPKA